MLPGPEGIRLKGRGTIFALIDRLALHAHELTFTHPLTRARQTLTSPLPKDFAVALKRVVERAHR